jgi:putative transposase
MFFLQVNTVTRHTLCGSKYWHGKTDPYRVRKRRLPRHVTARGNERRDIYRDVPDRQRFLETLEEAVERFGVVIHADCLMPNHYHLLLQSP